MRSSGGDGDGFHWVLLGSSGFSWDPLGSAGFFWSPLVLLFPAEEEYKRLSECLADEGSYNAVAFKYTADYYDPSQPTEEEEAAKEQGENCQLCVCVCV